MKKIHFFFCLITFPLYAQSLFESVGTSNDAPSLSYQLNGYIRNAYFVGEDKEKNGMEVKNQYSELDLQFKTDKKDKGYAFADVRFTTGGLFSASVDSIHVREAYANLTLKKFDIRLGKQIIVWGRADGFNPTNLMTPKNQMVYSAEEDDKRLGNDLVRIFANYYPFRYEFVYIPSFKESPLAFRGHPFFSSLKREYPRSNLKYSGFAFKINYETAAFDGSISYFNGYNPSPTLSPDHSSIGAFILKPYHLHSFGGDFSFVWRDCGFRGEISYRLPYGDYNVSLSIPNPELIAVAGIDRSWGDFTLILQYMGTRIFEYDEKEDQIRKKHPNAHTVFTFNRLLSGQTEETKHSVSFRPSWELMHQLLDVEILGLYSFTTEELYLKPLITYEYWNALELSCGAFVYAGPDESLYGMIDKKKTAFFIESKFSF